MADEKKNPLLGAFRSPAPGAAPPTVKLDDGKKTDEKKPIEPVKPTTDPKATPAAGTPAPVKADEKKPAEPAKPITDPKATPAAGTPAPVKADEKKPAEQGKTATDPKAAPTAGTSAPAKADEKKTAEPAKPTADTKAAPTTDTPAPVKPDEPPKPAADSKTAPAIGTDPTAEPDVEIPKNFTLPIAKAGQSELITTLKVAEIHPFEGHPFSVKDDKDMWDLVESVKQFGVLEPITVIPRKSICTTIARKWRRR